MTDGAKCYITFQEKYPQLVPYLMQLNHSVGEWARRVTLEGKKMTATTNKIDGAWSHLRRFFSNHNVSQADAFRYLKEFEFFFGQWAKSQNSFERMLYYMQLDFEIKNIKGPELADAWVDYSKSNISFVFKILKEKRTFPQFFVTKTQHNQEKTFLPFCEYFLSRNIFKSKRNILQKIKTFFFDTFESQRDNTK